MTENIDKELPFMYRLHIQAMANGFAFVKYKGHFGLDLLEPEEILEYIKKTPKKKIIEELEKTIKKIDGYKNFKKDLLTN